MNVLMISTDKNIFKESTVRTRMIQYGKLFNKLEIIIFSKEDHNSEKISDNVTIHSTNSGNKIGYINDAVRISKDLKDFDIVTTQDPFETGLVGRRISKKLGVKFHIQIHTDFLNTNFKKQSILNKVRVCIAKRLLPKADGIRVVSERIKESLSDFNLKSEPVVLPIFSDSKKYLDNNQKENYRHDVTILTVSRLESEKNVDFILDVFAKVLKKFPNTELAIIGEGTKKDSLIKKVNRLEIGNNVNFLGRKTDLPKYYSGADIYLQTSSYEGFGLALFEAALSGLPIVSTNVGLVGSILKDKESVLVTDLKKEDVVGKLEILLKEENSRKVLGENAKREAKKHLISEEEYLNRYKKSLEI